MIPLDLADIGKENVIKKIGGSPDVKKHLEDLGFTGWRPGDCGIRDGRHVIVKVKESRIAISREMARRIMI